LEKIIIKQDGKNTSYASATLTAFIGLVLVVIILITILQTAEHKNFWIDEKYEIVSLCDFSFNRIFLGKTHQANKSPLYFLLQKLSLSKIESFDSNILILARIVSIAAALLICLMLFIFIYARLGLLFAVFIIVSVASQYLFYQFAAENRPYMLWMLVVASLIIATLKMCLQSFEKSSLKNRVFFCISIFAVTFVISFGVIQSAMALLTCLFFWYFVHDRSKGFKPLINFVIPILLLCILIQGYYTLQGVQAFWPNTMGSDYDVISQLKKGDMSLLKMPARLLLPKPSRDAYGMLTLELIYLIFLFFLELGFLFCSGKIEKVLEVKIFLYSH